MSGVFRPPCVVVGGWTCGLMVVVLSLLAEVVLVFTGSFTHFFWFFGCSRMALLFLALSGFFTVGFLLLFFLFVLYT